MLDIKKLRELCEKATPGPWTVIGEDSWNVKGFPQVEMNTPDVHYFPVHNDADAQFIVAARTALPEALDEIERLKKEKTILAKALEQYADYGFYAFLQDPCGCHNDPTDKARTALSQIKQDEREKE